jgi:hypothetical protein
VSAESERRFFSIHMTGMTGSCLLLVVPNVMTESQMRIDLLLLSKNDGF